MRPLEQLPIPVVAVAREYARLLSEQFGERVMHVRLFGSQVRGDAEHDSDIDIAVVISGLTEAERTDAVDLAYRAWKLYRAPQIVSPLVWSDAEFEDRLRAERRIALDVLHEGAPV